MKEELIWEVLTPVKGGWSVDLVGLGQGKARPSPFFGESGLQIRIGNSFYDRLVVDFRQVACGKEMFFTSD